MTVNARALLVKNKTVGTDPLVDKILTEGSAEAELYQKALAISKSRVKKQYVEACLLASQDYTKISALIEIDPVLVEHYAQVFYNTAGLDKLSKLELVEVEDHQEMMMKLWALSQGLDFIAWRLGSEVNINPTAGLQSLFSTCIMKSKEAMFSGNDSASSIEATKWVKLSLDIARLLRNWVMDNEGAKKDIEIALREVIPDFDGFASLQELDNK